MQSLQTLTFSTIALAGATALSASLAGSLALSAAGCAGDEFTVGPAGPDDAGPDGSDSGSVGGDCGPQGVRPSLGRTLPPTHAFLLWSPPAAIPDGKVIDHYDVCWATGTVNDLGGQSECPNASAPVENHAVLRPLVAGTQYFWKVRAAYTDGATSFYTSALPFRTDDSLLGWWPMDEGSGAVITDTSGKGHQGALKNGAGFGSGLVGSALQCDGTDDYADLGSAASLNLAGALTVSAWVSANGIPASPDTGILNLGALNYALTYHSNGSVYFYIGNGGNNLNAPLSPNAWHHVTGVFDATTLADGMRLYVDGAPATSKASTTATTGAAGSLWIGRYASNYFRGRIDQVTLYGADLDDESVLNEFCAVQALSGAGSLPVNCQ
jgi:hypothetical protein